MRHKTFWLVYFILLGLVLIRLIPMLNPDARAWGFNHLIFISGGITIVFFVLAGIALFFPFFRLAGEWGASIAGYFVKIFYNSPRKLLYRTSFIIIMGVLFIIFSMKTHFLGDGYLILENVSSQKETILKWSEKGATVLQLLVQSILGEPNYNNALNSFRIISVISGIISLIFFFLIAGAITEDKIRRLLIFLASVSSGTLLLFFGYVENYPPLWIALTGLIYFGIRYLKHGIGLIWASFFLIFGLLAHLQMAIFVPAFIYLLFCKGKGLAILRRLRYLFAVFGVILIVLGLVAFINMFRSNIYFENMFLTLSAGKPVNPGYSMLSVPHLLDIINQLLLLSPLIIILTLLSFGNIRFILKDKIAAFLALLAIGGLLFLMIIDPTLAMPRDWDLFSVCAFGLTLCTIYIISIRQLEILKIFIIPFGIYLFLSVLPFLITNLNESSSINYIKYIINNNSRGALSSAFLLGVYYKDKGDAQAVDSLDAVYVKRFKNKINMDLAINAIGRGDYETAQRIGREIKPDKFSTYYYHYMSLLASHSADYETALDYLNKAAQLGYYNAQIFTNRAQILTILGRIDEAIDDLGWSYTLDEENSHTLEGLTLAYSYANKPDSSIYFGEKLLVIDSLNPTALFYLAESYLKKGDYNKALSNATLYQRFGSRDLLYSVRMEELSRLFGEGSAP